MKSQLNAWLRRYTDFRLSASQLAHFRDTLLLAKASGVDVTLFIGPMSALDLEAIRQSGQWETFQRWKRELTTIAPYWDFSGYSRLAYADSLFEDVAHFTPAVGHLILRHLLGQDTILCGESTWLVLESKVWVDAATVDEHLARQEADRVALAQQDPRPSSMVAAALHQ